MSILLSCPHCRTRQSIRNKNCKCGCDLDKAKRSRRVIYYISYRLPSGKQKQERVGKVLKEAKDAEGKRRGQIRENRIFEIMKDSEITFNELTEWYLGLEKTKQLKSRHKIAIRIGTFNKVFGDRKLDSVSLDELEEFRIKRLKTVKPGTIDQGINNVKTMILRAFNADKIDGRILKFFNAMKPLAKPEDKTRDRVVSLEEYCSLLSCMLPHAKNILIVLMNTGMRPSEARLLRWPYIDQKSKLIHLPAEILKENRDRTIPINHHVETVLDAQIRAIHHDFVFSYGNKPLKPVSGKWDAFKAACRNASVPYGSHTPNGITPRDFRRTVKTNMLAAGVEKEYRDTILGHSLKGMDTHYLKPTDDDLHRAMQKYTDWLDLKLKNVTKVLHFKK